MAKSALLCAITRHHISPEGLSKAITPENINQQNEKGRTALHCAVYHGHWDLVPVLIQGNADVNLKTCVGNTALVMALQKNAPTETTMQLISAENVNTRHRDGQTPLYYALAYRVWGVVPSLI